MSQIVDSSSVVLTTAEREFDAELVTPVISLPESIRPKAGREHLPLLDLLRVLAAHLIVWHHLSFYGPVSTVAYEWLPGPIWALSEWGRSAVQVFFVIGGFLMARSLSQQGWISVSSACRLMAKRLRRIGGPYIVLLVIAVAANATADFWMDHASISAMPSLPQFLAHVVFLQDILGYEPLTAGIWYLAIDLQLGLMLLGLTMLSQRLPGKRADGPSMWVVPMLMIALFALASLFRFNRDPEWEEWGLFFFGSYALGVFIEGALSRRLPQSVSWAYAGLIVVALVVEWRVRLAVGLATGLVIFGGGLTGILSAWPKNRWIQSAANMSFSLFLIHFPVCLVVNAAFSQFALQSPPLCLAGMATAYALSVAASVAFYRHVELAFR